MKAEPSGALPPPGQAASSAPCAARPGPALDVSRTPDQEERRDPHPPLSPEREGAWRGVPAGWGSRAGERGAALRPVAICVGTGLRLSFQTGRWPPSRVALTRKGCAGCPSLPPRPGRALRGGAWSQGREHVTQRPCVTEAEPDRQHTEGGTRQPHLPSGFTSPLWGAQKRLPGSRSTAWGGGLGCGLDPGPGHWDSFSQTCQPRWRVLPRSVCA